MQEDGNWGQTDQDKATAFATYLSNVFSIPQRNDNDNTEKVVKTFLDSACPMTLPITPISPTEVKEAINKCNNHKAPGFDLITGLILKELPRKAIVLLTTIYNSMLRLAYFPITWKFAQIIMIHKPGKPSNRVTLYRPISLLPITSKILKDFSSKEFKWMLISTKRSQHINSASVKATQPHINAIGLSIRY